jgi:cytochrome c
MKRFHVWAICALMAVAVRIAVPPASAAAKGDPAKGKAVFDQCAVCHNADSDEKKTGPGLKGLFKKDKLTNGKKPTEANVRARVDDGGNGMPAYKDLLSDQEKDDLIAYLKTL